MKVHRICQGDDRYPTRLVKRMGPIAPRTIHAIGNLDILQYPRIGLICSVQCPGSIIIRTFDAIRILRDQQVAIVGGFHSPMERDCLDIWLQGLQPAILCPAKRLRNLSIGPTARKSLAESRLLLFSIFGDEIRRTTSAQAILRNDVVSALSEIILVPHASNSGKTWATVQQAFRRNQRILSFEDEANKDLIESGAIIFQNDQIANIFD